MEAGDHPCLRTNSMVARESKHCPKGRLRPLPMQFDTAQPRGDRTNAARMVVRSSPISDFGDPSSRMVPPGRDAASRRMART